MPGASDNAIGNEKFDILVYLPAVTYPTLAASATANNTLKIPGVLQYDLISWNIQSIPAHLALENAYVSSPDTLTLTWGTDGTGVTGATCAILFSVIRGSNAALGTAGFPNAIV